MELKRNILDIKGIKVGQAENPTAKTGVSVVLAEDGAICGVDVRGAGPGTRETDLLNPINTVEKVHAVVLSGGSAFGLEAASGVMNWLEKRGIGFDVGVTSVPIVPSAVLFDLEYGDAFVRPDKEMGMQACENASDSVLLEGDYGAGCGATVGKLRGMAHCTNSGIGSWSEETPNGIRVAALIARSMPSGMFTKTAASSQAQGQMTAALPLQRRAFCRWHPIFPSAAKTPPSA